MKEGYKMKNFDSLVVFHCHLLPIQQEKPGNLFQGLRSTMRANNIPFFSPSTCVRQLYIFDRLDEDKLNYLRNLEIKLQDMSTISEILRGSEAYLFVLRWLVGLVSEKLNRNDHFVIGSARKSWTELCQTKQLVEHDLLKIMPVLFADAKSIRHRIESDFLILSNERRIDETEKLCLEYQHRRESDISPHDNHAFTSEPNMQELPPEQFDGQKYCREKDLLQKKLKGFSCQATKYGDDCIKINHNNNPTLKARFFITEKAIRTAYELQRLKIEATTTTDTSCSRP